MSLPQDLDIAGICPDSRELFWAVLGNLAVGFGAGTATIAAFTPTLPVVPGSHFVVRVTIVSVGFAFFFGGYHITQVGTYRDPETPIVASFLPVPSVTNGLDAVAEGTAGSLDPVLAVRALCIITGIFGLGAGMRLFAMTIESWSASLGVMTGLVCIGGYILGHIGINWSLI